MDLSLKSFLESRITDMVRMFNNSTPPQTLLNLKKTRAREKGKTYLVILAENAEYLQSKYKVVLELLDKIISISPQSLSDSQVGTFLNNGLSAVEYDISAGRFSVLNKYSNLSDNDKVSAMEKEYIQLSMTVAVITEIINMVMRDNGFALACKTDRLELKSYLSSHFPLKINNNLAVYYDK